MNKYLIILIAVVLSACGKIENFDCRSERVDHIKESIQRHEECRTIDNCIFGQIDIYYYERNKAKLAECKALTCNGEYCE